MVDVTKILWTWFVKTEVGRFTDSDGRVDDIVSAFEDDGDNLSNMQWQTVDKAKDKRDRASQTTSRQQAQVQELCFGPPISLGAFRCRACRSEALTSRKHRRFR